MIKFQRVITSAFVILLVFFMSAPLLSQSRKDCKADVEKLCAQTRPGQGRVKACLKSHQSELSSKCKRQLARWKSISAACRKDRNQYCNGKKGTELKNCIKVNRSKFSDACKNAVKKARTM